MKDCSKCPHSVVNCPENMGKDFNDTPCLLCANRERVSIMAEYDENKYYKNQDDPWGVKRYD